MFEWAGPNTYTDMLVVGCGDSDLVLTEHRADPSNNFEVPWKILPRHGANATPAPAVSNDNVEWLNCYAPLYHNDKYERCDDG